jgi:hypothetical protein
MNHEQANRLNFVLFRRCAPRVEFYVNPTSLAEKYAGCMALSRFRTVSSIAYLMQ